MSKIYFGYGISCSNGILDKTHFNITSVAIGNLYELEELFRNLKISFKCAVKCTIYKERRLQVFFIVQVFP